MLATRSTKALVGLLVAGIVLMAARSEHRSGADTAKNANPYATDEETGEKGQSQSTSSRPKLTVYNPSGEAERLIKQRESLTEERTRLHQQILRMSAESQPKLRELAKLLDILHGKMIELESKRELAHTIFSKLGHPTKCWEAEEVVNQAAQMLADIEGVKHPALKPYRPVGVSEDLVLSLMRPKTPKIFGPIKSDGGIEEFGNQIEARLKSYLESCSIPPDAIEAYTYRAVAEKCEAALMIQAPPECAPLIEEWRNLATRIDDTNGLISSLTR